MLFEEVLRHDNLKRAYQRVRSNKGAPGIDGMTVDELGPYLMENGPRIREAILAGTYAPQPVKRVDIPKAGGGVRSLGIPVALDRYIQQAILQVLTPIFDPHFSESSYGFRPGRSTHDAVRRPGNTWRRATAMWSTSIWKNSWRHLHTALLLMIGW